MFAISWKTGLGWRLAVTVVLALSAGLLLGGCFEAFKEPFQGPNWKTTITLPLLNRSADNGHQIMLDGSANPSGEQGVNLLNQSLSSLTLPDLPIELYQDIDVPAGGTTIPPGVDPSLVFGTLTVPEQRFPFFPGLTLDKGSLEFTDVKLPDNLRLVLTVTLTALDASGTPGPSGTAVARLEKGSNSSASFDSFFAGLPDNVAEMKMSASGTFERIDQTQPIVVEPDPGKSTVSMGAKVQAKLALASFRLIPAQQVKAIPSEVSRLEGGSLVLLVDNNSPISFDATLIVSDLADPYTAGATHRIKWTESLVPGETQLTLALQATDLALLSRGTLYVGLEVINTEPPGTTGVRTGDYLGVKAYGQLVGTVRKLVSGGGQ